MQSQDRCNIGNIPEQAVEIESPAAVRPPARTRAHRAPDGRPHGGDTEGAQPSNTAPDKYNSLNFHPLRYGVDSLYLSYPGVLATDWDEKLNSLKVIAQSDDERERTLAQVVIGSYLFEVKDKGKGRFAYVLADNRFHVQVSKSLSLPMAYVQISSEYISAVGIAEAEKTLCFIVNTLGLVREPANISRVDLFLDFVTDVPLDKFDPADWVSRTESFDKHWRYKLFSGWSIALGGDVSARLYDKTLEVEKKSNKFYLHDLWKDAGWNGQDRVHRMEFQAAREVLKQLGIPKFADLEKHQAALWQYFTQDWLRLAVPSTTDSNPSRWPNHPLWDAISGVYFRDFEQPRLKRFSPARPPSDEWLFINGLSGLTSFMAREGIQDFGEGLGEYLAQAENFHQATGRESGQDMKRYIARKVKAKGRRFNTIDNRKDTPQARQETEKAAKAYREAKEGDNG